MTTTDLTECAYCRASDVQLTSVPVLDADEEWAELATEHSDDCEWILTRAHRLDLATVLAQRERYLILADTGADEDMREIMEDHLTAAGWDVTVRAARYHHGEISDSVSVRTRSGDWQILGCSVPVPPALRDAMDVAWEAACRATSTPRLPSAGYVRTTDGRYLVQLPDDVSRWGFRLYDDDQSWDGGIGVATEWTLVSESEVPEADRERLGWLLEEVRQ